MRLAATPTEEDENMNKDNIPNTRKSPMFQVLCGLVRLFYGKLELVELEPLPQRDAVIVANHTQMNGPIAGQLFMPENCYIWCAGQMMDRKKVPEYAFTDFWSQKPKWTHPFYRMLSHLIAPLASFIFNHARTIAVHRDMRIMSTFRESLNKLTEGNTLLIFPEKDETDNNILYKFQENFINIAKLYYAKTGVALTFVPMYIAPRLRKMYIGKGITYNSSSSIEEERTRIADYLSREITKIARQLPVHTVIPYRNIPKRFYLTNKDITEVPKCEHR